MIISLLTPTRGRVKKCQRYLQSVVDTADDLTQIEALFYVDNDDPCCDEYRTMLAEFEGRLRRVVLTVGPFITVSKEWNVLAKQAQGDVLCMGNDDLVYFRKGWDTFLEIHTRMRVEASLLKSPIWCAWFYDGIVTSMSWPTFPMISRAYYETLGYFAPDVGFKFFYNDTWIGEVSQMGRCQMFIENPQYMRHLHHIRYQEETDQTTHLPSKAGAEQYDTDLFRRTVGMRQEDARKLRRAVAAAGKLPVGIQSDTERGDQPCP
jgi:hypothetical protein